MIFSCLVGIANYAIYMSTIDYMVAAYGPVSVSTSAIPHFSPSSMRTKSWAWRTCRVATFNPPPFPFPFLLFPYAPFLPSGMLPRCVF